mgnify:FL=1
MSVNQPLAKLNTKEKAKFIASYFAVSPCANIDKMSFDKVEFEEMKGKEIFFGMNENNSCTVPSGVGKVSKFNYPIAVYVMKLSDNHYAVFQTSSVKDRNAATMVVNTLELR